MQNSSRTFWNISNNHQTCLNQAAPLKLQPIISMLNLTKRRGSLTQNNWVTAFISIFALQRVKLKYLCECLSQKIFICDLYNTIPLLWKSEITKITWNTFLIREEVKGFLSKSKSYKTQIHVKRSKSAVALQSHERFQIHGLKCRNFENFKTHAQPISQAKKANRP